MRNCKIPTVQVCSIDESCKKTTLTTVGLAKALQCHNQFNLHIPCSLTAENAGAQLILEEGSIKLDLLSCNGNYVRTWQLLTTGRCGSQKTMLHCRYCSDPEHVQVRDKLPSSCTRCSTEAPS